LLVEATWDRVGRSLCAVRPASSYWMSLAIAIVLLATLSAAPGVPGLGPIALHVGLLQTPALLFDNGLQLGFGVIPPVWTLSVEVGFYLLLPLVAAWYFRHPLAGLAAAAAMVIGWHAAAASPDSIAGIFGADLSSAARARIDQYSGSQFPSWAFALAAGMTSAWAYVRVRDRLSPEAIARLSVRALAAASVALAVFVYLAGHQAVNDPSPLNGLFARQSLLVAIGYPAALAAAMLALSLAPERLQRPVASRPIRWFADISYGVYLIHFAVIWFALLELSLPQAGTVWSALVWTLLVLPVSIGYAYLSARFLERPVRRWARRISDGRARESHATA